MASQDTTLGWSALDNKATEGSLKWQEVQLRPFGEDDVDIKVSHCGICGTDTHAIQNEWGVTSYPCTPGHEIIGTILRVGSSVTKFQPGQRVGVGPIGYACREPDCVGCGRGYEQRCPKFRSTHNAIWLDGSSVLTGGFAKIHRTHQNVVIRIPDGIPAAHAAPLLCAGATTYAPLKRHGAGPGKTVGVLGIGGLGSFALLWAKALGCDKIVAISRSSSKKEDALTSLGATEFVATAEDEGWEAKYAGSLDIIISTSDSADMPMSGLLGMLRFNGVFVTVGVSTTELKGISTFQLCAAMIKLEGSYYASFKEIEEMLDFAAAKGIAPMIEEVPIAETNQVVVDQVAGKARYKYVLVHGDDEV